MPQNPFYSSIISREVAMKEAGRKKPNGRRSAETISALGPSVAADLDSRWHLARNEREITVTELEFSLIRATSAFDRWQAECLAAVAHQQLGSTDNAILHVIRLKERPKTTTEIARLLNRDDVANLQYSIRKLQDAGLIERCRAGKRKGTSYRVTHRGKIITEEYAALRSNLLMNLIPSVERWDEQVQGAKRVLDLMRGIYDQAALVLATHRSLREEEQ